jgi:DNA replication and repair protein RecF
VFHVEPGFLALWSRYRQALKQRNSLLRQAAGPRELSAWDPELARTGEQLHALRERYIQALAPGLASIAKDLLQLDVELRYSPGWKPTEGLAAALAASLERDRRLRLTHSGPHRADIAIHAGGMAARQRISRGQQKLLVAALILAQLELHAAQNPERSALLLDDPAAELDAASLGRLLHRIRTLPVQLFVTALGAMPPGLGQPGRRFHVEHGEVRPA